jgi:hypothetical protein
VIRLFDHRGEHVDVADGDAFGEEGMDEQDLGQAPAAQVLEGDGAGGRRYPMASMGPNCTASMG